ncbi:MAG TPA: VOC family protein [Bacteroidia bacterium]|jgi:predicted 3-demethylubiquinone-9 3-methyltransferase (glyoxalase superfamily)|nr:VOC family protein [Bacteroidia bacterium]
MATKISAKQKITPCLWFDGNAQEAAKFYISIFKKSKILITTHYGDNSPMPKGKIMTVTFTLNGQEFMALNGGPAFKFNEAISLMVNCDTQKEIDYFWEKLSEGGTEVQCGWLKDKYGLAWQIVPSILGKWFKHKNNEKKQRMVQALWQMKKLDIKKLEDAFDGK